MIPGVNPRQMRQAMKRLGMQQEEIEAIAVIIRTRTEDIIIRNPSVQRINIMGEPSYQVSGTEERRPLEAEINEADIRTVMEQAKAGREEAIRALGEAQGDLAAAILALSK